VVEPGAFFKTIKKHPDRFYIIHYSSQSLYDEGPDGLSPRITSIVVMHYSTRQTLSFALHAVAEELHIEKADVSARFDDIERHLLTQFYDFVRDRREKYWVHWNMRNLTYGFEHLEHRYRTLTGQEPPHIPIEVRLNLNDILRVRYGNDYAADPKMKTLMLLNGQVDPRFLTGAEEADAFKRRDFIRMNSSTISKVEFFRQVINLALRGKLRTAGRGFGARVDRLLESRGSRVAALVWTATSITVGVVKLAMWLHG
jgi:hypothetical protein